MRYFYVWVRKDIPQVQHIIQASHAVYEMGVHQQPLDEEGPWLVLLQVENETELLKVAFYLRKHIPDQFKTFWEPDPIWGSNTDEAMGFSAIATFPFEDEDIKSLFSGYKLYRTDKKPSFKKRIKKWFYGYRDRWFAWRGRSML